MMRMYVYGFTGELGDSILPQLRKDYNVIGWMGNSTDSTEMILEYLFGTIVPSTVNKDKVNDYEKIYNKYFFKFLLMVQRRGLYWKDIHEVRNEFTLLYYKIYEILNNKVDILLFANYPHEGADYIFYAIAKELNIKTLICFQSIFPNKVYLTTKVEDFGQFTTIPQIFSNDIVIEKSFNSKLFYMKDFEDKLQGKKDELYIQILKKVEKLFNYISFKIKNLINFKKEKSIYKTIFIKLIQTVDNYRHMKKLNKTTFFLKDISMLNKDSSVIYVPLHLQPELTTVIHGDLYEDQVSMIEALSSGVDANTVILVKENPYQNSFQRGRGFFKRLKVLPNVYMVDSDYKSEELLQRADIVATVSGTAGWEAIKGGKKSLIFGFAWYASLPGAYVYQENKDIRAILNDSYSYDFDEIKNQFNTIMEKCADGVVDDSSKVEVENFTYKKNATTLVNSLNKIILSDKTIW